jgi:uncharacterized protein YjbI with pentapeptide repeats
MERKLMTPRMVITTIALLLFGTIAVRAAITTNKPALEDTPRSVKDERVNRKLSSEELKQVLDNHKEWLDLHRPNYESPEAQSDRHRADLSGVNLHGAILTQVCLWGANLRQVNLSNANLTDAGMQDADLTKANLLEANLSGASLSKANLTWIDLSHANLSGTVLSEASLTGAYLDRANLTGANLRMANISGASLVMADLKESILLEANATGAYFTRSDLTRADLSRADLTKAKLTGANLTQVIFEPRHVPDADEIAYAENLSEMRWLASPQAMVVLRKAFRDASYRQQERELTYAIEHSQTLSQLRMAVGSKDIPALLEVAFRYVFFEATSKWGMAPGRALWLLIALLPVFAVPYMIALHRPGPNGIWRTWPPDRIRTDIGTEDAEQLQVGWLRALRLALYFSLLSAFNIGWRELNVGNWIQRLQANEYKLQPTGWVRTVSGAQALVSVFLLAMWALTYFGRPFE